MKTSSKVEHVIRQGTLSASWMATPDTLEELTFKCIGTFNALKEASEVFGVWSEKGMTKKKALDHNTLNVQEFSPVRELLMGGRIKTDFPPKKIIETLGYGFSLWNRGFAGISSSFQMRCGSSETSVSNSLTITTDPAESGEILTESAQLCVLKMVIEIWTVESAVLKFERFVEGRDGSGEIFLDKQYRFFSKACEGEKVDQTKETLIGEFLHGMLVVMK